MDQWYIARKQESSLNRAVLYISVYVYILYVGFVSLTSDQLNAVL